MPSAASHRADDPLSAPAAGPGTGPDLFAPATPLGGPAEPAPGEGTGRRARHRRTDTGDQSSAVAAARPAPLPTRVPAPAPAPAAPSAPPAIPLPAFDV